MTPKPVTNSVQTRLSVTSPHLSSALRLTVQPSRNYLAVASAIVIAGVLISASLFLAIGSPTTTTTVLSTVTVTTTTTQLCGDQVGNSTNVSISNCQLGITLLIGIKDGILSPGANETFSVSLSNDWATTNVAVLHGDISTLHHINESNPSSLVDVLPPTFCHPNVPVWIIVYNESGLPVQLNNAFPSVVSCSGTATGTTYQFSPFQTLTQTFSVGGNWHSSNATAPWEDATYSQFSPGQYTVLAFDEWSQPITLSFTVK